MPAYVLAIMNVTDPAGYEQYRERVPASIAKYGGRYLARGGHLEVFEGDPDANRVAVLEFESFEKAQEWWASPEYEEAKPYRQKNARSILMLVEGVT